MIRILEEHCAPRSLMSGDHIIKHNGSTNYFSDAGGIR